MRMVQGSRLLKCILILFFFLAPALVQKSDPRLQPVLNHTTTDCMFTNPTFAVGMENDAFLEEAEDDLDFE